MVRYNPVSSDSNELYCSVLLRLRFHGCGFYGLGVLQPVVILWPIACRVLSFGLRIGFFRTVCFCTFAPLLLISYTHLGFKVFASTVYIHSHIHNLYSYPVRLWLHTCPWLLFSLSDFQLRFSEVLVCHPPFHWRSALEEPVRCMQLSPSFHHTKVLKPWPVEQAIQVPQFSFGDWKAFDALSDR